MDPLSVLSGVVGLLDVVGHATMSIYKYASAVKNAPASCEKLLQELAVISGTLTNAKYIIENLRNWNPNERGYITNILNQLDSPDGPMQHCRKTLDDLVKWLSRDQKQPMRLSRRALWPIKEEKEAIEFIMALERHKTHFTLILSLVSAEQLLGVGDTTQDIRREQERVKEEKALHERLQEQRERIRGLVAWLTPIDVSVKHESSVRLHQPGTGGWLVQNEVFKSWRSSSSSLLWLTGIPGSGKTILMSTVIDDLSSSCASDESFVYYYCDFSDTSSVNSIAILRTLFAEVLRAIDRDWTTVFDDLIDRAKTSKSPPSSVATLKDLLLKAIGDRKVLIVLDALDECTERDEILTVFPQLVSKANVRLLIASRKEHDIYEVLKDFPAIQLKHESGNMEADMRMHVTEELRTRPKLARLPQELKEELATTLLEKADGMFRWVQCQLDFISTRRTRQGFQDALRTLPRGLNPTYERILSTIENEGAETATIAKRTLLWLVGAVRPLTLNEIMDAITIERGRSELCYDLAVLDSRDILEVCSSLVDYDPSTDALALSHYSVQEFLLSEYLQESSLRHYCLSLESTHRELAVLTITYLMFSVFSGGPCETRQVFDTRLKDQRLFRYAAISWYEHVRFTNEDDELFDLLESFIINPTYREQYLSFRQHFEYSNTDFGRRTFDQVTRRNTQYMGPLYHSLRNDHIWVIRRLIEKYPALLNEEITHFGTPLILAAYNDRREVVRVLLELGAAVDQITVKHYAGPGVPTSALSFAIQLGRTEIFNCLLARGASLYPEGGSHGDSLIFAAAYSSHPVYITELIRLGLDIKEKSREGLSVLYYALQTGSLASVKVLVEAGCGVNEEIGRGKTPLQAALELRSSDIIQYLLDQGATPEHVVSDQIEWAAGEPWFPRVSMTLKTSTATDDQQPVPLSVDAVLRVKHIFNKRLHLPVPTVREILDLAEYWVCTAVWREDYTTIVSGTVERPYVSVPIIGRRDAPPLRKVVFETKSHDQGWSDDQSLHGSYRWSYTWFEAGSIPDGHAPRQHIQANVHASWEARVHVNAWSVCDRIPELTKWLESFSSGDALVVYPKAQFPGWTNHVEAVRIDAYCAWV